MREVKLSTGETVVVRPLSGKDVRELDAMPKTESWTSRLWEELRRAGFPQEKIDKLPFPDIKTIDEAVSAETFGSPKEEKN